MPHKIHTDHHGVIVKSLNKGHTYEVDVAGQKTRLEFQTGSIERNGLNGMTTEALLAILIHRTKFLNVAVPCDENDRAIRHMEDALANLEVRSTRRITRGVDGTKAI